MDNQQPLLSLCIPTNGVSQWVFPVLDSIYSQGVSEDLYEVVVMDNGNNQEFKQEMRQYASLHENCVYQETDRYEFLSEIATYQAARGVFIKFINHRTKLNPGSLQKFLGFVERNQEEKPVVYFSNGVIEKFGKEIYSFINFDAFVKGLSYWSSWSTGMAFWKSDFEAIYDIAEANFLFPHTKILFSARKREKYIIDNRELLTEIPTGDIPKGRYNLFFAFGVVYPSLILDLYRDTDITYDTYQSVLKDNKDFLCELYWNYIVRHKKCSYDLSDTSNSLKCIYGYHKFKRYLSFHWIPKRVMYKLNKKDK